MWGRYLPHIPPLSLASGQMKMQIVPDSHDPNLPNSREVAAVKGLFDNSDWTQIGIIF